jgi:MFS transporter, DHA2 family, multidrug resistance protein
VIHPLFPATERPLATRPQARCAIGKKSSPVGWNVKDAAVPTAAQPDAGAAGLQGPRRQAAIAAVLAAMVLAVLDAAIANVALPSMARSLQVTPGMSVWIITAYQTALVMGLLPCAALGESWGYRRVFTMGLALFTTASALCALSPSLPWLVAARFLQGLGGSAVMALGIALLRQVVPQRQLGAAIGWNALAVALSSAAGPTLGALVLSGMSWPWLFALNLPLGGLVLLASRALPDVAGTARPLDRCSVALNAAAFACLVVGAELLLGQPLLAAALFATAVIGFAALIQREMPKAAPLIPLDLLRAGSFRISVMASVCCFAGVTMGLLALPFYLQHSLAQNTLMTGLYMTPWPLTVAIVAPLAGHLATRVSTAWLCAAGGACLAIGLAAASLWPVQGGALPLVPITMLCGLGFGLFQVPNNRNMFLSAPQERSGAAGGMQATARLAGQTAGGVVMSLLFTLTSVDSAPRLGLGIGAMLSLLAGLVSLLRVKPMAIDTAHNDHSQRVDRLL